MLQAQSQTRNMPRGWEPSWRRAGEALLPEEIGRPHMRRSNPIYAGNLEGITQALYDIYYVAAAGTTLPKLTLFQNQVGQAYNFGSVTSFIKTFNHTNLTAPGQLEAPQKHIVRAISFYAQGLPSLGPFIAPADLATLTSVYGQFLVSRKPYQDTILGRIPAGGGPFVQGALSIYDQGAPTVDGVMSATNGWPTRDNTYALAFGGVNIEQAQNFSFIIDPTQSQNTALATQSGTVGGIAANGIGAYIFLDGTLFRAVQ
jgi:hypothetical protein